MTTSVRQSKGSIKGSPWHGNSEDLARLVNLFLVLQIEAREKLAALHEENRQVEKREHEERMDRVAALFKDDQFNSGNKDTLSYYLKDQTNGYLNVSDQINMDKMNPLMTVTYKEFDTKDTGEPLEVLERMHVKQVREIELEYGRSHDTSGSGMRITLDSEGARAVVVGEEMFVNGSINRLKAIFRQQRPSVWWMRTTAFLVPLTFITTIGIVYSLVGWLHPTNPAHAAWWTPIAGSALFVVQWFGIRWLVPAFELVPAGKRSRSDAAIAAVVALLIGVGGSVIYGLIN